MNLKFYLQLNFAPNFIYNITTGLGSNTDSLILFFIIIIKINVGFYKIII